MNESALSVLEAEINSKTIDLNKLEATVQDAASKIPTLRGDILALQRTIAILKGEKFEHSTPPLPSAIRERMERFSRAFSQPSPPSRQTAQDMFKRETSIPQMVEAVLREANKPMNGDEVMDALLVKDKNLNKPSVMGAIYRNAKAGRIFKIVQPGVFGLLEFENSTQAQMKKIFE